MKTLLSTLCAGLLAWPVLGLSQPLPDVFQQSLAAYRQALHAYLRTSPQIQAARAELEAQQALATGTEHPLNNPELELEAERSDIDTLSIGFRQTLDWHDKRSAQQAVAQARVQAARAKLMVVRLEQAQRFLQALGEYATQRAISQLHQQKNQLLAQVSKLAQRRHRAGEIAKSELDLARLAHSEARMQQAYQSGERIQAEQRLLALSGQPAPSGLALPNDYPAWPTIEDFDQSARQHPEVQAAHLAALVARKHIQATDRGRKPDPSVGLHAGKEGDEALLGLSFSIPLQVRNDFQSEVDAARAQALQAEQQAQHVFWQIRARLYAAQARYQTMQAAWTQWQKDGQSSLENRFANLEKLWRSGEISTSDYLLQVQQTLDTQMAALELQGHLWQAWIEGLAATNQIQRYFD